MAQEGSVTLRIMAFPRSDEAGPLQLKAGKRVIDLNVYSSSLTEPIQVPAARQWKFGQETTGTDGNPTFDVWGTGKAGTAKSQIIMLIRKGPKNSDGLRVLSFDDGPGKFGERQYLILNLSTAPIAGEIGGVKFGAKPAQPMVITPKPDQGDDLCHAQFFYRRNDEWQSFFSSNWPLADKTRALVIIYSGKGNKLRLHTIEDLL